MGGAKPPMASYRQSRTYSICHHHQACLSNVLSMIAFFSIISLAMSTPFAPLSFFVFCSMQLDTSHPICQCLPLMPIGTEGQNHNPKYTYGGGGRSPNLTSALSCESLVLTTVPFYSDSEALSHPPSTGTQPGFRERGGSSAVVSLGPVYKKRLWGTSPLCTQKRTINLSKKLT